MISLSETWEMEPCKNMAETGKQKRYIDMSIRGATYRLNQDEAKALWRELGRMIAQIDRSTGTAVLQQ